MASPPLRQDAEPIVATSVVMRVHLTEDRIFVVVTGGTTAPIGFWLTQRLAIGLVRALAENIQRNMQDLQPEARLSETHRRLRRDQGARLASNPRMPDDPGGFARGAGLCQGVRLSRSASGLVLEFRGPGQTAVVRATYAECALIAERLHVLFREADWPTACFPAWMQTVAPSATPVPPARLN